MEYAFKENLPGRQTVQSVPSRYHASDLAAAFLYRDEAIYFTQDFRLYRAPYDARNDSFAVSLDNEVAPAKTPNSALKAKLDADRNALLDLLGGQRAGKVMVVPGEFSDLIQHKNLRNALVREGSLIVLNYGGDIAFEAEYDLGRDELCLTRPASDGEGIAAVFKNTAAAARPQKRAAAPSEETIKAVLKEAREAGLNGFAGECLLTAVAINRVLFDGKGTLVAARNKAFWKHDGQFYGHVAVRVGDEYWDADARPKPYEQIESWGMLDESDSYYKEQAEGAGFDWNEDTASEVERITFASEAEVFAISGQANLTKIETLLRDAARKVVLPLPTKTSTPTTTAPTRSVVDDYLPQPESTETDGLRP